MAREISPVCDFIFGSIRTNLQMDMVDLDLTIRMVKGIYTYQKDHTAESMIFTSWSKSIIPFPSLRCKIQVFQDEKRQSATSPWNNGSMVQFSAPPRSQKSPRNPRKHAIGKTRTQWSN